MGVERGQLRRPLIVQLSPLTGAQGVIGPAGSRLVGRAVCRHVGPGVPLASLERRAGRMSRGPVVWAGRPQPIRLRVRSEDRENLGVGRIRVTSANDDGKAGCIDAADQGGQELEVGRVGMLDVLHH